MRILCLAVGLGLLSSPVLAFESVSLAPAVFSGFVSSHIKPKRDYNEDNYGIGARAREGWFLGYYRNSVDRDSLYAGREWQWKLAGPLHVGLLAGAVTGYRHSVAPYLIPELVLAGRRMELALVAVPPMAGVSPVIAAQLRLPF